MSDTSYLRLSQIVKSYDGRINAVDGIDLDIAKGEFLTLLGPSGSGKTTTLMMIAGFEQPTSGQINLQGRDLTRVKPYRRNVGMVFQNYALFPHMTVARNIAFPLKMRRFAANEIEERVNKALDRVELRDHADKHPRALSGGQQQRVALARGLVFDPDVLLLDEPLGALDKNLREQMQVELKRIHRDIGITMVYVTHDQTEAMTMSDRVAVFSAGRIEQIDEPLTVYNHPKTRFVAEFIGDNNIFAGTVAEGGRVELAGMGPIAVADMSGFAAGASVEVLIRPEWLQIAQTTGTATDAAAGAFDIQITDSINYGDTILFIGRHQDHTIRVRASAVHAGSLREGQTIRLETAPDQVRLIHPNEP
ncbi:MAG: ABC transporter ATP-binding protein [Proteobacteria bacterium]|nr:ABC transporter ATP-binding protein [Pseudomonadota bacterium]